MADTYARMLSAYAGRRVELTPDGAVVFADSLRPRILRTQGRGPWRSKEYLAFVRSKPCCVCGKPGPSEAHHWGGKGSHGMGQKCSDALVSPLCYDHHRQWHQQGFFRAHRENVAASEMGGPERLAGRAAAEFVQIKAQRDCLAEWVAR